MLRRCKVSVFGAALLAASMAGCTDSSSPSTPAIVTGNASDDRGAPDEQAPAQGLPDDEAAPDAPDTAAASDDDPASQPDSIGQAPAAPRDEALFDGWPEPQVLLVISGEQDGYIEPCGCAGKENMKGGLSRRQTFLRQLHERGWETLTLDLGNQVRRYGRQSEIKFHSVVDGLRSMGYEAIGYGPDDLRLSTGELVSDAQSGFVSANVGLFGAPGEVTPQYRIVERGGRKIGITAVLGDALHDEINNPDITLVPAAEGLTQALAHLEEEQCDLLVLLSHAAREETLALAGEFPQFRVVVTAEGNEEPPFVPESVPDSSAWLVEVGHKGMFLVAIGLFDDPSQPLRYQRVPLDARFADSPEMKQLMAAYQDRLKETGLDGLEIRRPAMPAATST
jgi:hypothetical protein